MEVNEKAKALVERVIAKTKDRALRWERTAEDAMFMTVLGSYTLTFFKTKRAGDDVYSLALHDGEGNIIDSFDDETFEHPSAASKQNSMYRRLEQAYGLARRQAMGVDQALDDVLKQLE